jgi:carbonic anhydrase/acetyltransferase-like protein (isoleucine patch superfamily)
VIGAGAVLAPGAVIPDGKVVVGVPGRIIRDVTQEDMAYLDFVLSNYLRLGREHAAGRYPNLPHDVERAGASR